MFEAVPEILSLKESTFADLEKYAPNDCILASNSSSYKSGELVGKVSDDTKARVLNTHFMMPPEVCVHFLCYYPLRAYMLLSGCHRRAHDMRRLYRRRSLPIPSSSATRKLVSIQSWR